MCKEITTRKRLYQILQIRAPRTYHTLCFSRNLNFTLTSLAPQPWKLREFPSSPCMITTGVNESGPSVGTLGLKSILLSSAAPSGRTILVKVGEVVLKGIALAVIERGVGCFEIRLLREPRLSVLWISVLCWGGAPPVWRLDREGGNWGNGDVLFPCLGNSSSSSRCQGMLTTNVNTWRQL